jgi:DNA-binding NtrC family response regulator
VPFLSQMGATANNGTAQAAAGTFSALTALFPIHDNAHFNRQAGISMQPHALAGKRVLIAEDEPMIAMDHAALLTEAGAEIIATCATVRGAVDCIREEPIDVAVVDYVLADGNSEPLQRALKRKHIPFVVVSAYPRPLVRTEPGQEVLQKPVTSDLLCGRVEAACKVAA